MLLVRTDLDYCDFEWFALEMNRDHSVIFEISSKYCISDSLVDHDGYSTSSMAIPFLQCRKPGLNPWIVKIPSRKGKLPTPIFGLETSMDCIDHGVAKSRT